MRSLKSDLPPSNSHTLALLHPTRDEKLATWNLNGQSWRGRLSLPAYLRRETYLENQDFTKDGGITFWILVDTTAQPNLRPILASCESLRKRALIAKGDGQVEEIISHGIGSVFCNPEFRGRGYAQRMIEELGKKLDTWQQDGDMKTSFTVLYSDIGKMFYSRRGWHAFPSSHIALPPVYGQDPAYLPTIATQPLYTADLAEMCALDEKMLREEIGRPTKSERNIRVALIPDVKTMVWHHAREEFAAKEMLATVPDIKGAYIKTSAGDQMWCIWTRTFGSDEAGNTLHILRFMIEGERLARFSETEPIVLEPSDQAKVQGGAALLQAAQLEASKWDMRNVEVWNPSPLIVLAAREVKPAVQVIHRDESSIASLRWHGADPEERSKVDWVANEKYGWC